MPDALSMISTRRIPQSQKADPRQVKNSAGGYTFTIDPASQLRRFLILGTEGGTYYSGQTELTQDNAQVVLEFARNRTTGLVEILLELSLAGRAPRQNPILFALAAACSLGDAEGKKKALDSLLLICRTGTQLFIFVGYVKQFRGWGRGIRRAVAGWYALPDVDRVAYQVTKYRSREGYTHRDLLRLSHPKIEVTDLRRRALLDWVVKGKAAEETDLPTITQAYLNAQAAIVPRQWVSLINENPGLTWEMLPDIALTEADVWGALVNNGMPTGALIRQLPRLTRLGVLSQLGNVATQKVCEQLVDPAVLKKARIHPINLLVAMRTYAQGHGERGTSTWSPVSRVIDALDAAFYAAFDAVEPAGKNTMLALDVSGSMTSPAAGLPLTCREASVAIALVTAATEPAHLIVGFTSGSHRTNWRQNTGLTQLNISPRQRLDDAVRAVTNLPFGGTDCSLPMQHAMKEGLPIDTFVVYTDNETWHGDVHPHQALELYRQKSGIDARLIVCAMTPTRFSIASPDDKGMLDIVGLDSAVPTLINDFSRGSI